MKRGPKAKRGRPKVPKKTLELRGTRGKYKPEPDPDEDVKPFRINDLDRHAKTLVKKIDFAKLIKTLPGYDPHRDAGTDYIFKPLLAARVVAFFDKCLTHVEGEWYGRAFRLSDWQIAFVSNLFGWVHKKTGLRRYRTAFLFVARKNGKSALISGLCLYSLLCDGEPGAKVFNCATDLEQGKLVFQTAQEMARANPKLRALIGSGFYKTSIVVDDRDVFRVLTGIPKDGASAHAAYYDEVHEAPNSDLWEALRRGMGARRQPLMLGITTAGHSLNGLAYKLWELSRDIISGKIREPKFLPAIYEAPHDADWRDPKVWAMANPNLDISVKRESLEELCREAQQMPSMENGFRTKQLNQWVQSSTRWLPSQKWAACNLGVIPAQKLIGAPCFGGLDIGLTVDLTAFALYWNKTKTARVWTFLPERPGGLTLNEASIRDAAEYEVWYRQGHLELMPGETTDYDWLERRLQAIIGEYRPELIYIDRALSLPICNHLLDQRIPLQGFGQGTMSYTSPSRELERLVMDGSLNHQGNPLLSWSIENTSIYVDRNATAETCKPVKARAASRIDPVCALIMAIAASLSQPQRKRSVYETRELALA